MIWESLERRPDGAQHDLRRLTSLVGLCTEPDDGSTDSNVNREFAEYQADLSGDSHRTAKHDYVGSTDTERSTSEARHVDPICIKS